MLPRNALGLKISFSCFRATLQGQKSFFHASARRFRAKNPFFMLPRDALGPKISFRVSVWKFTGVPYRIRGLVFKNNAELPILRQFRTKNHAVQFLPDSNISESSFYRILHERGLLERVEHDLVVAADTIMRGGFMNRWTILHREMYIQGKGSKLKR